MTQYHKKLSKNFGRNQMPRSSLLAATAAIISDYRAGEIPTLDVAHIERWLNQFDAAIQDALLNEMHHVLNRTYISKEKVEAFLELLVTSPNLTGGRPREFWQETKFLNLQTRGNSQREFLSLMSVPLREKVGLDLAACGTNANRFAYIDDGLFTGNTLRREITEWLRGDAPAEGIIHIILITAHLGGKHYVETKLNEIMAEVGKNITLKWWALCKVEDRLSSINNSDVLRPAAIPDDQSTREYVASLSRQPILRSAGNVGELGVFSDERGRNLLEQQMLIKGSYIRTIAPLLNQHARPLGYMILETLGFGSTFVTYRNCPNNAPLAFWAGHPWYPLFPRKTNQ